jgi:hypothetical protein
MTAAFHQSASRGGPLRAGVHVRISYVAGAPNQNPLLNNAIIKLEIRSP